MSDTEQKKLTQTTCVSGLVDQKYSQLRTFAAWGQVVHEADPEPAGKSWARTPEKASELEVEVEADPLAVEVVVPHDDESDEEDDDHEPADSVLAESQADDDAVEAEPHESEEDSDSVADEVLEFVVVLGLEYSEPSTRLPVAAESEAEAAPDESEDDQESDADDAAHESDDVDAGSAAAVEVAATVVLALHERRRRRTLRKPEPWPGERRAAWAAACAGCLAAMSGRDAGPAWRSLTAAATGLASRMAAAETDETEEARVRRAVKRIFNGLMDGGGWGEKPGERGWVGGVLAEGED